LTLWCSCYCHISSIIYLKLQFVLFHFARYCKLTRIKLIKCLLTVWLTICGLLLYWSWLFVIISKVECSWFHFFMLC